MPYFTGKQLDTAEEGEGPMGKYLAVLMFSGYALMGSVPDGAAMVFVGAAHIALAAAVRRAA
jgi:hypothetical protein